MVTEKIYGETKTWCTPTVRDRGKKDESERSGGTGATGNLVFGKSETRAPDRPPGQSLCHRGGDLLLRGWILPRRFERLGRGLLLGPPLAVGLPVVRVVSPEPHERSTRRLRGLKELVGVQVWRRRAPALAHEGVAEAEGEGGEDHGDDRAQRQKGQEECASEGEELPGSVGETLQTLALQRAGLVELPTARTLFLLVKGQAPLLQLLGEERLHRLRSWLPLLRQVIIVYATPYQHVVSRSPAAGRAGAADRNPRPSGKGSPRRQRKPAITARHQPRHRHRRAVPGSVCDAFGSRVESSSRMKYL